MRLNVFFRGNPLRSTHIYVFFVDGGYPCWLRLLTVERVNPKLSIWGAKNETFPISVNVERQDMPVQAGLLQKLSDFYICPVGGASLYLKFE